MAIVFQYGSNCSDEQINGEARLRGDAVFVGIAQTVEDYQLAFDVQSIGRGCAASDIVTTPGRKVWGVLYEIPDWLMNRESASEKHRKSFDEIEGEGSNYRRTPIEVIRADGQVIRAITYVVRHPRAGLRTNIDYVRHIVTGLRQRGVPLGYIETVKAIAADNNPEMAEDLRTL